MLIGSPPTDYNRIVKNQGVAGPLTAITAGGPVVLSERWQTAIDTTNVWTRTLGGSGTATVATTSGVRNLPLVSAATTDTVVVNAKASLTNPLALVPTPATSIYQRIVMEWEAKFTNVANIDNTKFIMGIYSGDDSDRGQNNASGFILVSDALNALTDLSATETLTVITPAPTLTNWNKYKIIIRSASMEFYVNDVLVATHTTNLPVGGLLAALFYSVSDAAASSTVAIGPVRVWVEE